MTEDRRDSKRIKRIMYLLQDTWQSNSGMRFFQLMDMLQHKYSSQNNKFGRREANEIDSMGYENPVIFIDLFYLEDDNFEEFLREYINDDRPKDFKDPF